jgi:ribonuclease D
MFKESITKEELTDLPLRWFEGEIQIIEDHDQVDEIANF